MKTLAEIEARLAEIAAEVDVADAATIEQRTEEVKSLKEERAKILAEIEKREALKKNVAEGRTGTVVQQPAAFKMPAQPREERYTTASKEYRNAWAKTLLCQPLTVTEQRAIRDVMGLERREEVLGPVTTTSTEFIVAGEGEFGQNNGGLFIPEEVNLKFLEQIVLGSPLLEDTAKMQVPGLTKYPYKVQGDPAKWRAETEYNDLEAIEFAEISMAAKELSKTIRVTWKLEAMTPDSFINYLFNELRNEMQMALAISHIYGENANDLNGIKNTSLTVSVGSTDNLIDALVQAVNQIPKNLRMGAVLYLSTILAQKVALQKDSNGDYVIPPINGAGITQIGTLPVRIDPYLEDANFVVGNLGRDAILNTHESLSITKDVTGRCRVNDYTAYAIYSNVRRPGSIVFGTVNSTPTP